MNQIGEKEREELEMLMPWYVNGTLDRASVARIENALKTDAALSRSLETLLEDAAAVESLADAQPVPASMEARFMAQLDAEPHVATVRQAVAQGPGLLSNLWQWIGELLAALTPPRLALVAAAACLLLVVQSGIIVSMLGGGGFETASGPGEAASGPAMIVQFAPGADIANVSAFLDQAGARIADGPLPGGLYRLEFGAAEERSLDELTALLRGQPDLFVLVLPGS